MRSKEPKSCNPLRKSKVNNNQDISLSSKLRLIGQLQNLDDYLGERKTEVRFG